MAKLSARGRVELARYKKVTQSECTGETTHTYALMDDGRVLVKISWKGYPGNWTIKGKLKEGTKGPKKTLVSYQGFIESITKNGFTKV
jgi:hypothetical protein